MRDGTEQLATQALLNWYDKQARDLPWRVLPAAHRAGVYADPYRVWLSEVMLQQTTVAAVRDYFNRFTTRWPTVQSLAGADDGDVMAQWAGLGYYARARNLLKCARIVTRDHNGRFPETAAELAKLPGIGPYTAAAIASIAFDEAAVVVDGNVERVVSRLWAVQTPLPKSKPELVVLAGRLTPRERPGDHAQAMMDLGATICTPRNPVCALCPVDAFCDAHAQGIAVDLPKKMPKPEKPTRHGFAYVAVSPDGDVLTERRPDKGLLGGMIGFPGSEWGDDPAPCAPLQADWHEAPTVRHTFTHFHLILRVFCAVTTGTDFTPANQFDPKALPTVMRKAWDASKIGAKS